MHRALLDHISKLDEYGLHPDESNVSPGKEIQSIVIPNDFVDSPTPRGSSQRNI